MVTKIFGTSGEAKGLQQNRNKRQKLSVRGKT